MKSTTWPSALLVTLIAVLAVGCTSTPRPDTELALARESIERAKVNNAYQIAPRRINTAESKLSQAMVYIEQQENEKAARLLKQANKDAEAAIAEIDETRAKESLEELSASMAELEKEIKDQRDYQRN